VGGGEKKKRRENIFLFFFFFYALFAKREGEEKGEKEISFHSRVATLRYCPVTLACVAGQLSEGEEVRGGSGGRGKKGKSSSVPGYLRILTRR